MPTLSQIMKDVTEARKESKAEDTLKLTLYRKYFDEIYAGTKGTEFRQPKYYWLMRLFDAKTIDRVIAEVFEIQNGGKQELFLIPTKFRYIEFTNGYGGHRPRMKIELKKITLRKIKGEPMLCLELSTIRSVENYNP